MAHVVSFERRKVYSGKTMSGEIFMEAEVEGYASTVTVRIGASNSNFTMHLGRNEAEELARMLLAAVAAAEPAKPWTPHKSEVW